MKSLKLTEKEKEKKGKITSNENEEVVRVTWSIYCKYLSYIGGITGFFALHLALILFMSSKVYNDYLVGQWAYSVDQ